MIACNPLANVSDVKEDHRLHLLVALQLKIAPVRQLFVMNYRRRCTNCCDSAYFAVCRSLSIGDTKYLKALIFYSREWTSAYAVSATL